MDAIKDPMAQCKHYETVSLANVADRLRKMRLDDVSILQKGYDQGARERVDKFTDVLNDLDRIGLANVDFIQERQRLCKDCPNK